MVSESKMPDSKIVRQLLATFVPYHHVLYIPLAKKTRNSNSHHDIGLP